MEKVFQFLERFHGAYRIVGYFITWGGFLIIVVAAVFAQGYPNGLIGGLCVGAVFALLSWLGFRKTYKDAVLSREKLQAYSQGQTDVFKPSRQVTYAIVGLFIIGAIDLLLIFSCVIYTCANELTRPRLILIILGFGIAIDQLFRAERVTGKLALVLLAILVIVVVFLIGKVVAVW